MTATRQIITIPVSMWLKLGVCIMVVVRWSAPVRQFRLLGSMLSASFTLWVSLLELDAPARWKLPRRTSRR